MNAMQSKTSSLVRGRCSAVAVLAGCSGGGAPTVENPVTTAPPGAPTTPARPRPNADVQAFRINLWENIKANNRCGGCHNAGGQTPDVRAQRRREPRLPGGEHGRESHAARSVAHGHEGRRRPQLLAAVALGLRRHAHRLDPQLGRRVAPRAARRSSCRRRPSRKWAAARPSRPRRRLFAARRSTRWCCNRRPRRTACAAIPRARPTQQSAVLRGAATSDEAYAAIKSKINLDNPAQSRLVVRLRDEFHNCWGSAGCAANAQTMLDAVNAFAGRDPGDAASIRRCSSPRR